MTNFWEALSLLEERPEQQLEYRLYYNEDGTVRCYSMEQLDGNYINVDVDTFNQCRTDLLVRNGEIIRPRHDAAWKLVPSKQESYGCHPNNVSIVVDSNYSNPQHWSVKTTHEAN